MCAGARRVAPCDKQTACASPPAPRRRHLRAERQVQQAVHLQIAGRELCVLGFGKAMGGSMNKAGSRSGRPAPIVRVMITMRRREACGSGECIVLLSYEDEAVSEGVEQAPLIGARLPREVGRPGPRARPLRHRTRLRNASRRRERGALTRACVCKRLLSCVCKCLLSCVCKRTTQQGNFAAQNSEHTNTRTHAKHEIRPIASRRAAK